MLVKYVFVMYFRDVLFSPQKLVTDTYAALKSSGTQGRHTFIHAIYSNTQEFNGSTKSFIYFIHVLAIVYIQISTLIYVNSE